MLLDGEKSFTTEEIPLSLLRLRDGALLPSEPVLSRRLVRQLAGGRKDPVIVRECRDGYEIIAGDVEYALAKNRDEGTLNAIVQNVDEEEAIILRLAVGSQRGDLNPLEAARLLNELLSEYGLTQQEAAVRCGWTQATVANKIRLLKLPQEVLDALEHGAIGERQARALLMIEDDSKKVDVLKRAIKMGLSAAEIEEMCRGLASEKSILRGQKKNRKKVFKDIRIFQNGLRRIVSEMRKAGLKVSASEEKHDEIWEFKVTIES